MECAIEKRVPTIDEFNFLRMAASWPLLSADLTKKGLANSLFGVCLMKDGTIIGMGRVVGDDAIYFHIADVIVHPDHQRMGYGTIIMEAIMRYIESTGGSNTNVGLMSSKGREEFYEAIGFIRRPAERFGAGMIKIL
jgi:ribosomal protein S18 acetylase RimI-like enzyme